MDSFEQSDHGGPERVQLWPLEQGEYVVSIGLFQRVDGELKTVNRADSHIQVESESEAKYYFGQFTDLKRRVRKLERAVKRLV